MKTNLTKAYTWQSIGTVILWLWFLTMVMACSLCSCSDNYEVVEPQTLKYEVEGESYFAIVKDPNAHGHPYMLEGHRELHGSFEIPAKIGDSLYVMVTRGGTPWDQKDATLAITLGTDTIYKGDTKETGYLIVRGVLGQEFFIEKKK